MIISTMVPSRYMKVQWHGNVIGSCVWESHHRPASGFPQQSSGIAEIWFLHFGLNTSFIKQSICQWIMMPWNSCDITAMLSVVIHRFTGSREKKYFLPSLRWRRNGRESVSNHEPHNCLLNRSFRRRSKKTSNSASLAFVRGFHRGPVNSPHKWPVTPKCFHLMTSSWWQRNLYHLLDFNEVVAVARPKHLLWNCTVFCWLKNDICNRHVFISLRACKNYGNSVRSNLMLISVAIAEDMVLKSRPASACRNTVSSQFWYDHLTNLNFIKKNTQTSRY